MSSELTANTINCVCLFIRSIFRVLGTYDFVSVEQIKDGFCYCKDKREGEIHPASFLRLIFSFPPI